MTSASLLMMIAGVAVCSYAGRWKEQRSSEAAPVSYGKGRAICIASEILSSCGNLGFVYGAQIADQAQTAGVPPALAPNAIWALLTLALFACNSGYADFRLHRNDTAGKFLKPGTSRNFALGVLMGLQWIAGFVFYGASARRLGPRGPSLGWAMLMSVMVISANAWNRNWRVAVGASLCAPVARRRTPIAYTRNSGARLNTVHLMMIILSAKSIRRVRWRLRGRRL